MHFYSDFLIFTSIITAQGIDMLVEFALHSEVIKDVMLRIVFDNDRVLMIYLDKRSLSNTILNIISWIISECRSFHWIIILIIEDKYIFWILKLHFLIMEIMWSVSHNLQYIQRRCSFNIQKICLSSMIKIIICICKYYWIKLYYLLTCIVEHSSTLN